jgi:hypothetical protein
MDEQKFIRAEELRKEITEIKDFVLLCKRTLIVDEVHKKENTFKGVNFAESLVLKSYICTGSQSPKYQSELHSKEVIREILFSAVPLIKAILEKKELEYENL